VDIRERIMITDLLTSDGSYPSQGRVVGAVGIHTQTGQFYVFKAKAVVVTSGLITGKLHFSYGDNLSGDGQAMAYRAGAELAGLEFNFGSQFAGVKDGRIYVNSLIQFQTQGAHLINGLGERFMERYMPERKERRSTMGLIAQAMVKEMMEGRGPIYFDMRHFTPEHYQRVRRIIPITMAAMDGAGIDIRKERVLCRPMVTWIGGAGCGGIKTNTDGETNIPGLLAAGISAQYPGCAESLSGLKISACSVFGYRAGQHAARIAEQVRGLEIDWSQVEQLRGVLFAPGDRKPGLEPMDIYRRLAKKLVNPEYSIIKSEATIKDMLAEAAKTGEEDLPRVYAKDVHELVKAAEARNWVLLIEPVYSSALERKESRLNHYRRDYPYRDDIDWLKWVIVRREGGKVKLRHEPLPVEEFPITLPKREKIPAAIQLSP
ncbi:MAG: FAD-binding protein, partial [Thermodesulfobacteriota bacterium]